jgi:Flp pilus assembly pilin Flp
MESKQSYFGFLSSQAGLGVEGGVPCQVSARGSRGASLIEYVLLLALVTLICIAAMELVGTRLSQRFSVVASELERAP